MKSESEDKKQQGSITYPKVTTWDVFKEYWKSVKPHSFLALLMFLGWVIAVLSQSIITPIYYKKFFDVLAGADPSSVATVQALVSIILTIFLFGGFTWSGFRMAGFAQNFFETKVLKRIYEQAFSYLIKHSFTFFSSNFAGALTQRVGRFSRSFSGLVDRFFGDLVPLSVKIVAAIIVLYFFNPSVAYILFAWIIIF